MQRDVVDGPRPCGHRAACVRKVFPRSSCTCRRGTARWVRATVAVTGVAGTVEAGGTEGAGRTAMVATTEGAWRRRRGGGRDGGGGTEGEGGTGGDGGGGGGGDDGGGMAEEAAVATEGKVVVTAADFGEEGRCVEWRADAACTSTSTSSGWCKGPVGIESRPSLYAYPAPVQLVLSA